MTPDQRLFQSATADYLNGTMPISTVRELADAGLGFDRDWWRRGAELGWTAMLVPESLDGGTVSGSPMVDLALVAGEMGRTCAPGPLITTSAALTGLVRAGDRFAEAIGAIVIGDTVVAWAWYAPERGMGTYGVHAEPHGDGYRLSGSCDRVESGDQADMFLVTAGSATGPVQLLIPADVPGLTVTPVWTLDLVRRTALVTFDDVLVGSRGVVQRGTEALAAIEAQSQVAATLASIEMAAAAQRTFDFTTRWMFDRYSFGRPLASYQALKHRMADNRTWLEACHATASAAARTIDQDPDGAAEAVSAAKSYVGAKTPVIVQDCVQLHGGIGVTWEHDIHLYLRRVTLYSALYGTPAEHRRRLADLLDRRVA